MGYSIVTCTMFKKVRISVKENSNSISAGKNLFKVKKIMVERAMAEWTVALCTPLFC